MTPKGGSEILKEQLLSHLDQNDLKDINLIMSICHPDLIQKDKINVVWQHLSYDQQNVQMMADRRFVDSVDHFIYVSNWSYQNYKKHFDIPDYKTSVLKNASLPFLEKTKNNKKIKLIYTSTPWRGLNVLVMAIRFLSAMRDDFECDVYSSTKIYGKAFDDMEKDKYEPLYQACRETNNMNYKGYAANSEIREAVLNADILAYPSIFEETSCLSVIEAMLAGCKVVTTNLGALPETCCDFADMVQFEPNAVELAKQYANQLNQSIDHYKKGLYKKQIEMQKVYYQEYYTWPNRIKEWKEVLKNVRQKRS